MTWSHRDEDWSVYLIPPRLRPHPSLEPRRGGYVTVGGYEHVICPHCQAVAVWDPDLPADVRCLPPGHRIEERDGAAVEVCPKLEDPP